MRGVSLPLLLLSLVSGCNSILGIDERAARSSSADGGSGGAGTGAGGAASGGAAGGPSCNEGDTLSCYQGPPGTEGVGPCTAGTITCVAGQLSPCEGQVVPTFDDCATGADDDCSGAPAASCSGLVQWSLSLPGQGPDSVRGVAAAPDGSLFVAGVFRDDLHIGAEILQGPGGQPWDVFVAKLTADGEVAWARDFGPVAWVTVNAMVATPSSDVVLAGYFKEMIDFGAGAPLIAGGSDPDNNDPYLARIDAFGNVLWQRSFSGPDTGDHINGLAVDGDGQIYFAGMGRAGLDLEQATVTDPFAAFVGALTPLGEVVWAKAFGAANWLEFRSLATDGTRVMAAGSLSSPVDFGGGPVDHQAGSEAVVAVFGTDGTHLMSRTLVGAGNVQAWAVAPGLDGRVNVAGQFTGSLDFDGSPSASEGDFDAFVAQLEASGAVRWSRTFGSTTADEVMALQVGPSGNLHLVGTHTGALDIGSFALPAPPDPLADMMVAKLFHQDGSTLWARSFGGAEDSIPFAVSATAADETFIGGHYADDLTVGASSYGPAGTHYDGVVIQLAP